MHGPKKEKTVFPSTWLDGLADVDRETSNPRPLSIKGFDAYFSAGVSDFLCAGQLMGITAGPT